MVRAVWKCLLQYSMGVGVGLESLHRACYLSQAVVSRYRCSYYYRHYLHRISTKAKQSLSFEAVYAHQARLGGWLLEMRGRNDLYLRLGTYFVWQGVRVAHHHQWLSCGTPLEAGALFPSAMPSCPWTRDTTRLKAGGW